MTDQHRATPEQWDLTVSEAADCSATHACILELRARVEALEAAQQPHQDKLDRLIALDAAEPFPVQGWHRDGEFGPPFEGHLYINGELAKTGGLWQHVAIASRGAANTSQEAAAEGRCQPLRTEITYGEVNARAQGLVRRLSMDQPGAAPAPAESLVERVAAAIDHANKTGDTDARAAIREVAAWLRSELHSTNTADLLEQEADR